MNNLLVAYDFSPDSDKAMNLALTIADKFDSHIWLLHIAEPDPEFVGYKPGPDSIRCQIAIELRKEHKELQKRASHFSEIYSNITPIIAQGATADTIISQANKIKADIIFIRSKGKNKLEQLLLGSVSDKVVTDAKIPVLVCR